MDPAAFWTALTAVVTICVLVTGSMAAVFGVIISDLRSRVADLRKRVSALENELATCEKQRLEKGEENTNLLRQLIKVEHDRNDALQVVQTFKDVEQKRAERGVS